MSLTATKKGFLRQLQGKALPRLALILLGFLACLCSAEAASRVRLVKVLPHFMDREGRVALSPSLYERDAYQHQLRTHREERGGLLFEVQWKSRELLSLTLKVEMRGNRGKNATTSVVEQPVRSKGFFSTWSRISLKGDAYTQFGELSAWRATLWDGDKLVAEQKSFLW